MVLGPAALASHGTCYKCRILVSNPNVWIENLHFNRIFRWLVCTLHLRSTALEHCCYYRIVGYSHCFNHHLSLSLPHILNNIITYCPAWVSLRLWYLSSQLSLYSLFILFSLLLAQIFLLDTLPYKVWFHISKSLYWDYQTLGSVPF